MNNRKPLYGVGINDADYAVRVTKRYIYDNKVRSKTLWFCPYYKRWSDMLKRCYNEKFIEENPTYKGCKVCDEWLTFSNFKGWMENQNWQGKYLDKDILGDGKLYSPTTCRFITNELNTFITHRNPDVSGDYPLGVSFDKRRGVFKAEIKVQCKGKFLGHFKDPLEAHKAWQVYKIILANNHLEKEEDILIKNKILLIINKIQKDIDLGLETKTFK